MLKFGRNYSLTVQVNVVDHVVIEPPFTLEFDVDLSYYSSQSNFNLKIINLADFTRNKLRKDQISFQFSDTDFREVVLSAGYGEDLFLILRGNVVSGQSYRQGTEFITELSGFDSGFAFANGYTANRISRKLPNANKSC